MFSAPEAKRAPDTDCTLSPLATVVAEKAIWVNTLRGIVFTPACAMSCASGGYPPPLPGGRFYDSILSPILWISSRARAF